MITKYNQSQPGQKFDGGKERKPFVRFNMVCMFHTLYMLDPVRSGGNNVLSLDVVMLSVHAVTY